MTRTPRNALLSPRRAALGVGLVLVFASPRRARAEETEPIRITYEAPAACPDASQLIDEITARTRRARVAVTGESGRTFGVTIRGTAAKARGRLTVTEASGRRSQRDVAGGTCEEVVSAIGLIAALAIDPQASTAAHPSPPPPAPPPAVPPRRRPPPPTPFAPIPWWGPIGMPLPVIPSPLLPAEGPRWRPTWGLVVGGMSAIASHLVLVTSGFVEVDRVGGGLLSPSLRLGAVDADSGFRSTSGLHEARFSLLAARAEGCPVRLRAAAWLAAYPCVRMDAGQLTASGFAHVSLATTRPWAAPGLGLRARAGIASRLHLEAEGGALFPLVRDTFAFGIVGSPASVVQTVPPVGGYLGIGIGTLLP